MKRCVSYSYILTIDWICNCKNQTRWINYKLIFMNSIFTFFSFDSIVDYIYSAILSYGDKNGYLN